MSNIQKLQYISLCQKVTQELQNNIGQGDKDLAEFIIDLAKEADELADFRLQMDENGGGEFTEQFIEKIYKLIIKMLPKSMQKQNKPQQQSQSQQNNENITSLDEKKQQYQEKFPGLAIHNDDKKAFGQDLNEQQIDVRHGAFENEEEENLLWSSNNDSDEDHYKKKKNRSRSRSNDKKKKKKKSHKHNDSDSDHHNKKKKKKDKKSKKDSKKSYEEIREIRENEIYDGIVVNIQDIGCFVQLQNVKGQKKDGLVHISAISTKRVNNIHQFVQKNQKVYVKVLSIAQGRIRLSMKEVDQETGKEIKKQEEEQQNLQEEYIKPIEVEGTKFGAITQVKIRNSDMQEGQKKRKRDNSVEAWENKQAQYWAGVNKYEEEEIDLDQSLSDENEVNIELADKEPRFLENHTTKSGVILSPVRLVKVPDGSLNKASLNALQFAKDRRELKEQQKREMMENIDKNEIMKDWNDPNATNKILPGDVRSILHNQEDIPDFKKEILFKTTKKVNKNLKSMKQQKEGLPIFEYKKSLIENVQKNRVLIVIGETGSGKTTQMTQYLLEAGFGKKGKKIACTQPRRVAATSVSKRVAEEMGVVLGEEVGYTIRFEDKTSKNTIIKYMTDGMLLREALMDPDLKEYSVVMLDEAHERNLNTDILFGILKKVVARRKDFTLIVTSATLDAEKFSSYFFDCKIFFIPGRTFPVDIFYSTEPEEDYLEASLICVMQIHLHEPPGDILLFLTGQEEIDNACQTLHERMKKLGPDAPELIICPVYASLPNDVQNRIFMETPEGSRKIVIATNIAEASLTIDGIYYVIDPGFAKTKVFNPKLGMDSLQVSPISQASAKQRAGRAGRTGPGKCYRLYTQQAFENEMLPTSIPEIQRTNLANTVLSLKAMGINDLLNFDFMDPPPVQTLISALEQLYALGCLDEDGLLTKLGMKMAEFPLEPPLGKMLLTAVDLGCADEICTIIAMLQVQTIFLRPKEKQTQADQKRSKFINADGDHLTILTVYEAWKTNNFSNIWCNENYIDFRSMRRAQDIRKQLCGILERYKLPVLSAGRNSQKIRKSICAGFFQHASKKDPQEGFKTLLDNHTVYIHPSSSLFNRPPEWVIYHELVMTSKEYMRNVTTIDPKWLIDVAPNFYQFSSSQSLNSRKRQEKIEPLAVRNGDPNEWRLSRR